MLTLYNKEHKKLNLITEDIDTKIEKELKHGEETLSFSLSKNDNNYSDIELECYVRTKENEYIVKSINDNDIEYTEYICQLNLEDLEGNSIERFETVEKTIQESLQLALAGTGWTIGSCNVTKRRTIRKNYTNILEVIFEAEKVYMCNFKFDSINKKIYIYSERGSDKGVYFSEQLNLQKLDVESDSYDYCTRIIPIGKDGLKITNINNGKDYVENYQYSNKVITKYWEDNRYTVVEDLKADAEAKLQEISKPRNAYKADIIDLAKAEVTKYTYITEQLQCLRNSPIINPLMALNYNGGGVIASNNFANINTGKQIILDVDLQTNNDKIIKKSLEKVNYNILSYSLGDTITLVSKSKNVREKQRIVKITEYPNDNTLNTCEIANRTLNFEDMQSELLDSADTVEKITNSDNTIDGTKVDGIKTKQIEDFEVKVAEITDLKAINADIENLHTNKADIQDLNAVSAVVGNLEVNKANIDDLNAVKANIDDLNANKANITDLNATNAKVNTLEANAESVNNLLAGNIDASNIKAGAITAGSGIIADGAIGSAQISELDANKINTGTIDTSKVSVKGVNGYLQIVNNKLFVVDKNNYMRVELGDLKQDGSEFGFIVRGEDGQTVMIDQNGVHNAGITDGAITNVKVGDNANIDGSKLNIDSVINTINTKGVERIDETKIQVGNKTLQLVLSEQLNKILEEEKEIQANKLQIQATQEGLQAKVDQQIYEQDKINIDNNFNAVNTNMEKNTTDINIIKDGISSKVSHTDLNRQTRIPIRTSITVIRNSPVINPLMAQNYNGNGVFANNTTINIDTNTIENPSAEIQFANGNIIKYKTTIEEIENLTTKTGQIEENINTANSEITQLNNKIETKVSTEEYNTFKDNTESNISTINTNVNNNTSSITQLSNKISSKVEQTTFDTTTQEINGKIETVDTKINTANSEITQLAGQIASKVDVNGVKSTVEQNPDSVKMGFNGINDNVEITEKGTIFKHPDIGTKTLIDPKGFSIYDIGDNTFENPLGSFWGSDSAGFNNIVSTEVRANRVFADNIETIQEKSVTYYVRPGFGDNTFEGTMFDAPFDSVNYALSKINKIIPHGVTVHINVYDSIYERIIIEGFRGGGTLIISFDANSKVYSKIIAFDIRLMDFTVKGGRTGYNANNGCMIETTDEHGIEFYNVENYTICGFRGNGIISAGADKYKYMLHAVASRGSVKWLDSYGYYGQIYSEQCSITRVHDNRGRGSHGYLAYYGSIILGGHDGAGTCMPIGTNNIYEGGIIDIKGNAGAADCLWNPTNTPSPTPTKKIYTKSWSATTTQSWRDSYGWRSDNRYIYQGSYGYGNHRGFICFNDADIRTQLSGATIKSARLYLKRRNAGGSSATQQATMYLHNYSSTGGGYSLGSKIGNTVGYAWGTGAWSSIPVSTIQALQNGSARGIALYVSGSPYMIFEATATLEIVYEK